MKFIEFYIIIVKKQETDADDMPPPARGCLLKAGGGHWNQFPVFKLTIIYLLLFFIRSFNGNYGVFSVESNSQVVCLFAVTTIYNIIYRGSVQ